MGYLLEDWRQTPTRANPVPPETDKLAGRIDDIRIVPSERGNSSAEIFEVEFLKMVLEEVHDHLGNLGATIHHSTYLYVLTV